MSKKLKRMLRFIVAFAFTFIAVKPVDVKAVNYDENVLTIVANEDGTISVSDFQGESMNDAPISSDFWWGFDYMGPEGFTPSFAYESGATLDGFNWRLPLIELGAPAGDYALRISLLTSGGDGRTVVVASGEVDLAYTTNYTVIFDSSDFSGSYVGTTVSTQKLSGDKNPVLPDAPVRDGYDFDGWYLYSMAMPAFDYSETNKDGCTAESKFGTAELSPYDGAVYTFRANWTAKATDSTPDEQKEYKILEGGEQTITQGSGKDLVVRADGELADSTGVFVDGEDVEATLTSGSTIATIKAAVLDKMTVGTHKLTFTFKDGSVSTTFTIKAAEATTETSTTTPATVTTTEAAKTTNTASPKTGDEGIMIYGILMLLSLAGMIGMSLKKKDN